MTGVRRTIWVLGTPGRAMALVGIRAYQASLSGWLGGQCRFSPTCSAYTADAIRARGFLVGAALGLWRVLRCNPFGKGGLDPAPAAVVGVTTYESITQEGGPS